MRNLILVGAAVVLMIVAVLVCKQKEDSSLVPTQPSTSSTAETVTPQVIDLPHFFWACQQGETEAIKEFLKKNISVDATDKNGYTCLMMAAYGDHIDTISFLIDQKANLIAQSHNGMNALHLAIQGNSLSATDLLLSNGVSIKKDPLLCRQVWLEDHKDMYNLLNDRGICELSPEKEDIDARMMVNQGASSKNKLSKQQKPASGNVTQQNAKMGNSQGDMLAMAPEYEDAFGGPLEENKAFVAGEWSGKNLSPQGVDESLCFEVSNPSSHSKERIKTLLQNGANVNCDCDGFFGEDPSTERKRVTSVAVGRGNVEALQLLLAAGADVQKVDSKGRTLLIETCKYSLPLVTQMSIAEILLKTELKVNAKDSYGMTALDYVEDGKDMLRELLVQHGAKSGQAK